MKRGLALVLSALPGDGRLAQCIRDNASKFSEPCRQAIDAARGAVPGATDEAMDY